MNLPWLELLIVRAVFGNPSLFFRDLVAMLEDEADASDVADAVCFLVHKDVIALTNTGFVVLAPAI